MNDAISTGESAATGIPLSLTHVELTFVPRRIEHWIRFGHAAEEKILDRRRRILSFSPGSIFAFVRWAANDYGTDISRMDIVRAISPGEAFSTLPFIRPGGEILLRVTDWAKIERVLQAIDTIEAIGIDPTEAAPISPLATTHKAGPFAAFIAEASKGFELPDQWIRTVMRAESFDDPRAISPKGAIGLMQIMPETCAELRARLRLGRGSL